MEKLTFLLLHLGYGGIESATINTVNTLSNDYEIELVVSYQVPYEVPHKINDNIIITYLTNLYPNRDKINDSLKNKQPLNLFIEGLKALKILFLKKQTLRTYIKSTNSNIIVSTRLEFSEILAKNKSSNIKGYGIEHRYHDNDKKYINAVKKYSRKLEGLLVLSDPIKDDFSTFFQNENINISVIPNMISPINTGKTNLKNNTIITVGRLHPVKGFSRMIEIFSKVLKVYPDTQLKICGDGEEYELLNTLIKTKKIEENVHLLGMLDKDTLEKEMLTSDIYCMTSHSEGLPMVLIEAMNFGLPCIAYNVGEGIKTIIEDDVNGYLINNNDEHHFIEKLKLLINGDNENLSKHAMITSKKYSQKVIKALWIELFSKGENNEKS